MVLIVPPPPTLSPESISVFYVLDDLLARSPILVYYGPSATPTAVTPTASNNSRIQAHVFSPAGFQSYPRLTVSPSSPLYAAVNCLPREEQGDDVTRGLAFSLCKYFAELPPHVKTCWENANVTPLGRSKAAPQLFGESHAALLASRMMKVENTAEVVRDVAGALAEQSVSWLDLDVVLPVDSIKKLDEKDRGSAGSELEESSLTVARYGEYAAMVKLFGEPAFLPTARLRRAPSRPTGMNRLTTFSRKQKENIRREMCELLDTEENYVSKLDDLIHNVAADFREKAKSKGIGSNSPSAEALKGLFPESLDKILVINTEFLDVLRKTIEDTENDAIQDIESTTDETTHHPVTDAKSIDMTGTVALATVLRNWFPKFADCYSDFTRAHSQFSQLIKALMKESGSSFSKRINDTGEQRLMSMLIEPVQRLPRYNLYIDNIIKQLPAKHPAIKILLKARDTVSEICSQDSTISPSRALETLKRLVPLWPVSFRPYGRLITAIDAAEVPPPYRQNLNTPRTVFSILLIFTDYIVVLKKPNKNALSARGLMAQVDGQNVSIVESSRYDEQLVFRQALELSSFDITEVDNGKMIQIVPNHLPKQTRPSSRPGSVSAENVTQMFLLLGMHEGKASRVLEDITKARVEGRFSETEREGGKWEVRAAQGVDLTFFATFSEEHDHQAVPEGRGKPSKVRVRIDPHSCRFSAASSGVDVHASLSKLDDGFFRLEVSGPNEFCFKDDLTPAEFLPVLTKRLANFLQLKNQIRNPTVTKMLILKYQHILQSLKVKTCDASLDSNSFKSGISRQNSPVKMLTNLFGGSGSRDNLFKRPSQGQPTMSLETIPNLAPHQRETTPNQDAPQPDGIVTHSASTALERLEDTLSAYLLALHARRGNIVGRALRARHTTADLTVVNDLYNALLESSKGGSNGHQLAAQAPVDVLFAAFEQFIHRAWQEKMGPVISRNAWVEIQQKLDGMSLPGEFEETFRAKFADMSPQNQRALKSIVKLLADLLEGTGNDGDRGILTASFAEVLVPEGEDPRDLVGVLDCLIEDSDGLLTDGRQYSTPTTQQNGSLGSETRYGSKNSTGGGNTSSLRKKFGLLTRKGSKRDNLPFTIQGQQTFPQTSSSLSKASTLLLNRSNSDAQQTSTAHSFPVLSPTGLAKRPISRDRPTVLGAFAYESSGNPPGSSGSISSGSRPLSTIGETPVSSVGPPKKKKRRSSLSDLAQLREATSGLGDGFIAPRTPGNASPMGNTRDLQQSYFLGRSPSPHTPSPSKGSATKGSMIPQPSTFALGASVSRPGSPIRKDNPPSKVLNMSQRTSSPSKPQTSLSRPGTSGGSSTSALSPRPVESNGTVTITSHPPGTSASPRKRNTGSITNIPVPKNVSTGPSPGGLSERPTSGNVRKLPPTPSSKPPGAVTGDKPAPLNVSGKSRAAVPGTSPVKSSTNGARNSVEDSKSADEKGLAAELKAVGEELASLQSPNSRANGLTRTHHVRTKSATSGIPSSTQIQDLESRLSALSTKHASLLAAASKSPSLTSPSKNEEALRAQITSLEKLNREISAENDALYGKFNEELARVLNSVRAGKVEEEYKKRMQEVEEDAARLRRENVRLRRELASHATNSPTKR